MPLNEFGQPVGAAVAWTGAQLPVPVTLAGAHCRIEPLRLEHAESLYAALAPCGPSHWTYLSFDPPQDVQQLRRVVLGLLEAPGWTPVAIGLVGDPDGLARGTASYLRADSQAGSIEIGGIVLGDGLRGTPASTEAMWLLARQAFAWGYRRLEWKCDELNERSRKAALRLGFRFEGVFRQALVYKGRNRDTAWYAITDTDWPQVEHDLRTILGRSAG